MGLYEGIKDAIGIAQKADNIELYKQLLDLGSQALEMQAEITRLRGENEKLKNDNDLENRIVRHKDFYITLKDDPQEIHYCPTCWGNNNKLIQLTDEDRCFICDTKWCEAIRR